MLNLLFSISYVKHVAHTSSLYPILHTLVALDGAMAVAMAGAKALDVLYILYLMLYTLQFALYVISWLWPGL